MVFAEIAKKRFDLTLKSGLLCAVILVPATALADSTAGESEKPTQVAMTTVPDIDSSFEAGSTEVKPTNQNKAINLSQHIQRKYGVPEYKATQIVQEAMDNGDRHQLEPELILAIIAVESTFKERAVSRVGARGLMQVMPGPHRSKIRDIGGSRALFDPAKNIHIGSRILAGYLDTHSGNLRRALLNYNGSLGLRSSFPDRVMRIYRDLQRATTES
ncbi:MAG TPA: lytic transglycosylase domain-containing protein [Candidatus Competibacter sp.]|nr:lytic transglycosylase domain-containing protein [Candidatus Competibacter sp.]